LKTLNETFTALKLEKHPDKTFIGRTRRVSISSDTISVDLA